MLVLSEMEPTARTADVIKIEQRRAREKFRCSNAPADEHRIHQVRLSLLFLVVSTSDLLGAMLDMYRAEKRQTEYVLV